MLFVVLNKEKERENRKCNYTQLTLKIEKSKNFLTQTED